MEDRKEIIRLRELLTAKDKRIRELEKQMDKKGQTCGQCVLRHHCPRRCDLEVGL